MKKLISLTILFTGISFSVFAQIKLGIKISPQITYFNSESKNISTNGASINMPYGLMVDYHFTENYAVATEFSIASYSGNVTAKNVTAERGGVFFPSQDVSYDYTARYISIPILLKMRTKEIGYFRYFAEFGLDNNFLIKSAADVSCSAFSLDNVNVNKPDKEDAFSISSFRKLDDDISFFRESLIVGIGLQYNVFGNTLLTGGLRYNNSFTSFTAEKEWSAKSHCIALNIGVLF